MWSTELALNPVSSHHGSDSSEWPNWQKSRTIITSSNGSKGDFQKRLVEPRNVGRTFSYCRGFLVSFQKTYIISKEGIAYFTIRIVLFEFKASGLVVARRTIRPSAWRPLTTACGTTSRCQTMKTIHTLTSTRQVFLDGDTRLFNILFVFVIPTYCS